MKSTGDFRLDGSTVRGNGTLLEGNRIETTVARSVVELNGSAQFTLSPKSAAKMYRDRAVLEQGTGVVKDSAYNVEAASLRIAPASKDAVIQVEMTGPKTVSVFARGGSADVRNSSGILVASLRPGMGIAFTPQASSAATKLAGKVVSKDGKFLLTDDTTKVTVELKGADVAKFVGKSVEVTGKISASANAAAGAPQVLTVASIKGLAAGAAGAGAGAGAAAATSGIATGTTVAIVGGVAAAAAVGGLAAAGALPGQGDESASR